MADHRRFELFARFVAERFPTARRVYDVAGGMGRLNEELTRLGREVTRFDVRVKRLPVRYAERLFTLDEPCEADVVVGLHADGATRLCIDYAAKQRIAFAVVPCCSENGTAYNPWRKHQGRQVLRRGRRRHLEPELQPPARRVVDHLSAIRNLAVEPHEIADAMRGVVGPTSVRYAVLAALPGLAKEGVDKRRLDDLAAGITQKVEPAEAAALKAARHGIGVRPAGDIY